MVSQLKSAVPSIQSDFSRLQTVAAVLKDKPHNFFITTIAPYTYIPGRGGIISLVGAGHLTRGLPRLVPLRKSHFCPNF